MANILNNSPVLKNLYDSQDLQIWPESSLNAADSTKPLVILMHGLSGNIDHMVNPFATDIFDTGYFNDTDFSGISDEGTHKLPPIPEIGWLIDLAESIRSGDSLSEDALNNLNDLLGSISPPLSTPDPSWFSYFQSRNFPVIAYSQQGAKIPLDDDNGAFSQFLSIMQNIHENLLVNDSCRKIAFVAHSRGGIIARRYIVEALYGSLQGSIHEEIVESRVRFLGTLNSPHFGSSLGDMPGIFSSIMASNPLNPLRNVLEILLAINWLCYDESYREAAIEINPNSSLIKDINIKDLILLDATPEMSISDISNFISGDGRIKRIRRASTSGDQPRLLRVFLPSVYTPESFIPFPSTDCFDYLDFLIPNPMCYHWEKITLEFPFSPIIDEKNPPSLIDFLSRYLLLNIPIEELHAARDGHQGGDLLVTASSGMMFYSDHTIVSKHHGHPLWNPIYKNFILSRIPPNLCYPLFTFKIGDNLVELSWNMLSFPSKYKIIRFLITGITKPDGVERSSELAREQTIFYDPVSSIGTLKYLISYQLSSGEWAHEIDNRAFFEAEQIGSCPLLIKCCQPDEGQDFIPYRSYPLPIAASKAGNNYIIFSVTRFDLLTDCIDYDLLAQRPRINVTQNEVETSDSEEEDESEKLIYRFSQPFSSALGEEKDRCIATWIEHTVIPLGIITDIPGVGGGDFPGTVSAGEGGYDSPSVSIDIPIYACQYVFRIKAGKFNADGEPLTIQIILPDFVAYTKFHPICYLDHLSPPIEPPRFVVYENGLIFASTGISPYYLFIVKTDKALNSIGEPIQIKIKEPPIPVPAIFGDVTDPREEGVELILQDLFPAEQEGRYIALITEGCPFDKVYVVNFSLDGTFKKTQITLPWTTYKCQGVVFKGENAKLVLFISNSGFLSLNREPHYTTFNINDDHSVENHSNILYIPFTDLREDLDDTPLAIKFTIQDVLRRCDTDVEVLISTTGYFQDEYISSSLYRVSVSSEGVQSVENQHHSGYGDYKVTFSRTNYPSDTNAMFWLTYNDPFFIPGLYGQTLLRSISRCLTPPTANPALVERKRFFGELASIIEIMKIICPRIKDPKNPEWGRYFCNFFILPEVWYHLIQDPLLFTPSIQLLREMDGYVNRINIQQKFPSELQKVINPTNKTKKLLIHLLDKIEESKNPFLLKQVDSLKRAIKWEHPQNRAKELSSNLIKQANSREGFDKLTPRIKRKT